MSTPQAAPPNSPPPTPPITTPSEAGEVGADAPAQPANTVAMESQLAKLKRLVTMSRQRLEENQKQLTEKSQLIDRLTSDNEALRTRLAKATSASPPPAAQPRTAVLRVDYGDTIWVLFEFEEELEPEGWRPFKSVEQMEAFTGRESGEPVRVPPPSLTPDASEQIRREAQKKVEKAQEELRRFRVRQELALRQKEAEIKQISSASIAQHQLRIDAQDLGDMVRQAKAQEEKIASLRAELADQEKRWKAQLDTVIKEKEALEGAGADATLASQWRHRYEHVVREKEDLASKLDVSGAAPLEQKYQELKDEYKSFRKKATEALMGREAEFAGASGGRTPERGMNGHMYRASSSSFSSMDGEDPRIQYLKNLQIQYFSTEDPQIRNHTERAICTVLQFSEDEMKRIQNAKVASGAGAAGQWVPNLWSK